MKTHRCSCKNCKDATKRVLSIIAEVLELGPLSTNSFPAPIQSIKRDFPDGGSLALRQKGDYFHLTIKSVAGVKNQDNLLSCEETFNALLALNSEIAKDELRYLANLEENGISSISHSSKFQGVKIFVRAAFSTFPVLKNILDFTFAPKPKGQEG